MRRIILSLGGLGLSEPPAEEEWESQEIQLMDNQLSELPLSPNCPSLKALYLQRNFSLTCIPPLFFQYMPALQVLDMSGTSVRALPESLPMLVALQKLFLRDCPLLMEISPQVGELGNLEVLDLDGTEIVFLPAELGKLTKLKCLKVSFYAHVNRCKKYSLPKAMIHPGTLSSLSYLTELSLDVCSTDERWSESVQAVIKEVCCLKLLRCISLYLPEPKLLDECRLNNSLPIYHSYSHFSFVIGDNKRRYVSRVPPKANSEFNKGDKCLKFVNGRDVPREVQRLLEYSTSLFLDCHRSATSLSEFGMKNMVHLKYCLLAECNEMEVIFDMEEHQEEAADGKLGVCSDIARVLGSLEYLDLHDLRKLERLWKPSIPDGILSRLKFLGLHTCPKMQTVFSYDMLKAFVNLEELIVEDCPQLTSLVSHASSTTTTTTHHCLPSLKKLLLLYLPELVNISNELLVAPKLQKLGFYGCPRVNSLSKRELSSRTLKMIRGEAQWWEDIKWSETEWGSRPNYLACNFSPVSDYEDLISQFLEDVDSSEESRKFEGQHEDSWTKAIPNMCPVILKDGELAKTELLKGDNWKANQICLTDNKLSELPASPQCPMLGTLCLQRNYNLTIIPPLFFEHMPVLTVLDLSDTSIKCLPKSFSKLVLLQELFLRDCKLMIELPSHVGELTNLEVLDLHGTQIIGLTQEIGKLTKLKCLRVSFYGSMNFSKKAMKFETMIEAGVLQNLSELTELSIHVNSVDMRWNQAFDVVITEASSLKKLKGLSLHVPNIEFVNKEFGKAIDYRSLTNFKFTIGGNRLQIISRVPHEVEAEFEKWDRCLKLVNGNGVRTEVNGILSCASAFFLDHHKTATSLSSFGLNNMQKLKFCLLLDCEQIDAIIDGGELDMGHGNSCDTHSEDQFDNGSYQSESVALPSLLYMCIHYMKNLRTVWKGPICKGSLSKLKHLAFHSCPQLSTIFSLELIQSFVSLEVLILEDCPKVTGLVTTASTNFYAGCFFPSLKRIELLYLLELASISSGLCIAPKLEFIAFYNCPSLKRLSKMELSSDNLKVIKGESSWWEGISWDETEWGGQPEYLMHIFTPLNGERDVRTELVDDGEIAEGSIKYEVQDCRAGGQELDGASSIWVASPNTPHASTFQAEQVLNFQEEYGQESLPLVTSTDISEDTLKQSFSSEVAAPPAKISLDCDSQSSNSNYPSTKSAEEDDGYDWSISIQGKEKPMGNERQSYYVCKQPKCQARKIIVRSFDSQILGVVYTGRHDHSRPGSIMASPSPANSDQSPQNPKSGTGRDATCENEPVAKRTKIEKTMKTAPTRVALRTKVSGRDGLLSDGFSWRKYGSKRSQKGTISSYYRCSSHGCSANKCVEREPGDSEFVITTYFEKIHNHDTFFLEDINSAHVLGDSSCQSASKVSQPAENGNSSNAGVLHKYDNSSELGSCKAHTKSTGIQQDTVVLRSDGVENPASINVEQNCGLTHHG